MAVVPILTTPNDILHKPAEKIREFDAETKKLITDLLDTLRDAKDPEGAGLAAPQIGVLKRALIARRFYRDPDNPEIELSKEYVFVNPKIISSSEELVSGMEACLSIPDTYGLVERPKKIKVKALDEHGEVVRKTLTGFMARIVQHEIDHLDGILFTDKLVDGKTYTEQELDAMYSENAEEL